MQMHPDFAQATAVVIASVTKKGARSANTSRLPRGSRIDKPITVAIGHMPVTEPILLDTILVAHCRYWLELY